MYTMDHPDLTASKFMENYFGLQIVQVCCSGHVQFTSCSLTGELRLSGNHTVSEYEMSGEPYSKKSGWIKNSNERIFQVMTFK